MAAVGESGRVGGMAMESLTGRLLVATPALKDPNFERTVVMLVAHETGGTLGVVLNRATEITVADVLDGWGSLAGDPAVVFEGGPMQPESAICLARVRSSAGRVAGFNRVSGTVGTLDLSQDPATVHDKITGMRVFAGYAGWEEGQLESEIKQGSWFVFETLPGDAFMNRPDELWPMVLRRQGGLMAAVAIFPADPTMN